MEARQPNYISGNDLGFGLAPTVNHQRMINHDGSSNISRKGSSFSTLSEAYISLITMSWTRFSLFIFLAYILINSLFAVIYLLLGITHLTGIQGKDNMGHFFDAFFFSAQTISTVGYGHIAPEGFATSAMAAFESMLGLLAFALATGLLYGRFSRPYAKISYSKNMLVAPYLDGNGLMFRLANLRNTQLIEVEAQVMLSINAEENGKRFRKFVNLPLERNKINILTLSWTVVHPLNQESPIYSYSREDLAAADAEFLVLLKAFDDTFSQTVHSRTSYREDELIWKAKFTPVFAPNQEGVFEIDLSKVSDYELLDQNTGR